MQVGEIRVEVGPENGYPHLVQEFEGGPIFTNQVLVDNNGSKCVWWSESGEDFPAGDGITTSNWLGEDSRYLYSKRACGTPRRTMAPRPPRRCNDCIGAAA